ncbi:MAG: PAS domain S-box protein [Gammaproteobacteria bacterium]|nr:PAS domain S-box protein [Gammaproteobacteria bacterium]
MVDLTKLSKQQLAKQLQAMLNDLEHAKSEGEQQRILHDLRVHQIELEMQNRQLRETQQRLEISRDRYSDLYDFSPVGYVTLTNKGLIEQINLTGAKLLGKPREQVTDLPLSTFLPKADQRHFFNYLHQVFESDTKLATELRLKKDDNTFCQVYLESIAVRDEQGKANTCRCAIVDISEKKHAEELLCQAHDELEQRVEERTKELNQANKNLMAEIAAREQMAQALQASEARYRSVVDSQSELICRWRPDGTLTFVNAAYCRNFDKTREELVGHSFMPLIPEEDHAGIEAHFASMHKDNPVGTLEHRVIAPNGQIRWQRWTNHATFNEKGQIVEFQSVGNDVTERRQVEMEVKRYREHLEELVAQRTTELQASNKELEAFSYTIAHDLRSPLRSITSFSQILKAEAAQKLNDEELDSLNRVISSGKYMAQLIDDILRLARITRNEMRLENIDVSAMCQQVAARLNQSEPERSVTWKIAPGINVWGDHKAVAILLDNLLENAWKFTRDASNATIELGTSYDQGEETFFVKDNGVGFDMQYVNKLFHAFQRLHHPSQFEGTGIGLATVRHIVERHGGKVWVQAVEGEGATFYISLPKRAESRKNNSTAFHHSFQ